VALRATSSWRVGRVAQAGGSIDANAARAAQDQHESKPAAFGIAHAFQVPEDLVMRSIGYGMVARGFRTVGIAALLVALAEGNARGEEQAPEEQPAVAWKDAWPRVHWAEYALTGALVTGVVVGTVVGTESPPRWDDTNGFDDGLRDTMRVASASGRDTAGLVSDVLLGISLVHPFADSAVALIAHGDPDLAWQMAVINTEAFALTQALSMVIKASAGRPRPFTRECAPGDAECLGNDYASSFLSGHASMAFTGAGLVCAHHMNMPLYGNAIGDGFTCVMSLGVATGAAMMRVAADKHYASDIIAGAALGMASGWVLPNVLHYQFGGGTGTTTDGPDRTTGWARASAIPMAGPSFVGLGAMGIF
jgi:hypothetical protein